jgi:hypothetical protein
LPRLHHLRSHPPARGGQSFRQPPEHRGLYAPIPEFWRSSTVSLIVMQQCSRLAHAHARIRIRGLGDLREDRRPHGAR